MCAKKFYCTSESLQKSIVHRKVYKSLKDKVNVVRVYEKTAMEGPERRRRPGKRRATAEQPSDECFYCLFIILVT